MLKYKSAIFDLDGVIVDTAKYHFLAWKRMAEMLGFGLTKEENELLKGVNRMRCLDIILEKGGISMEEKEKQLLAEKKNNWYLEYIDKMDESMILTGAREYILGISSLGVHIAVGSASKNAGTILKKIGMYDLFDVIVDGNMVKKAKPDPEVFIRGAELLGISPSECIVFEDSWAGIEAAKLAGMKAVGIGTKNFLDKADIVFSGLNKAGTDIFYQ